jgi:predicted RNA binding protein YcfA (HicA-like mRNA interferase family)
VAKLPVLRPREVVAALQRANFYLHHQTGSHAILRHRTDPMLRVTVPMHARDLKRGTLRAIIRSAGMSVDGFLRLLSS